MGDIPGFQLLVFPHYHTQTTMKIPKVPLSEPDISIPGPPFWPCNNSYGVHLRGQGGKVDGSSSQYKNPPIPRRLVDLSPYQRIQPPGYSIPPRLFPGVV